MNENDDLKMYKDINNKFDDLIKEFNERGTEFSRRLADKVMGEKKYLNSKLQEWQDWREEHISEQKSDLISIKQGQNIFLNEIFPNIKNKVDASIKVATQSCVESNEARKSADRAEDNTRDSRKLVITLIVGLIMSILTIGIPSFLKLAQDKNNQTETVEYLKKLSESLSKQNKNE